MAIFNSYVSLPEGIYVYVLVDGCRHVSLSTLFGMMFEIWDRLKPPASMQKFNGRSMVIAVVAMPVDFAKCSVFFVHQYTQSNDTAFRPRGTTHH